MVNLKFLQFCLMKYLDFFCKVFFECHFHFRTALFPKKTQVNLQFHFPNHNIFKLCYSDQWFMAEFQVVLFWIGKHDISYFVSYTDIFANIQKKGQNRHCSLLRFLAWQIACRKIARDDPIILTFCLPALKRAYARISRETFWNRYLSSQLCELKLPPIEI